MSSGAKSTKQNDNDSRVVGDCPEFETEGTFGRKKERNTTGMVMATTATTATATTTTMEMTTIATTATATS